MPLPLLYLNDACCPLGIYAAVVAAVLSGSLLQLLLLLLYDSMHIGSADCCQTLLR